MFHSFVDVTIKSEGLQILTNIQHSRPLISGGSVACHTYCDTRHPFIMVISEDSLHCITERLAVDLSLPVFTTGIRTPNLSLAGPTL